MNKEFIPYELQKELYELGFSDKITGVIVYKKEGVNGLSFISENFPTEWISGVLYQQAFRWFRENHNLFHSIYPIGISTGGKDSYRWRWAAITIFGEDNVYQDKSDLGFLTYEEAELACLKNLIEIIKNK